MRLWEEAYLASGGDVKSVLGYYLHHSKGGKQNSYLIVESLRKSFSEKVSKQERNLSLLLEGLKNLIAGYQKDEDRLHLLELLVPIFSRSELEQRGIELSREMWDRARKNNSAPRSPYPQEMAPQEPNEEEIHQPPLTLEHHMVNAVQPDLHLHPLNHEHLYHHHHLTQEDTHIPTEDDVPDSHGLKRAHEGEEMSTLNYHIDVNPLEELPPQDIIEEGRKRRKLH